MMPLCRFRRAWRGAIRPTARKQAPIENYRAWANRFLHWGANFTVSQTFPILLASVGAGVVFLGYALVASAALLFVRSRVTETKGRSLEEIEAGLQGKAAPA